MAMIDVKRSAGGCPEKTILRPQKKLFVKTKRAPTQPHCADLRLRDIAVADLTVLREIEAIRFVFGRNAQRHGEIDDF